MLCSEVLGDHFGEYYVSSYRTTWARLWAIPPGPKKRMGVQFCTSPKIGPTRVSCLFFNFQPIFEFIPCLRTS